MKKMHVVLCIVALLLAIAVPALASGSITKVSLTEKKDVITVDEDVTLDDAIALGKEEEEIEDVDEYNDMIEKKVEDLEKTFFEVDKDDEKGSQDAINNAIDALKEFARKGTAAEDQLTPQAFYEKVAPKNAEVPEEQKQQVSADSELNYEEATTKDVVDSLAGYHFSTQFAILTRDTESKKGDSETITLKVKESDANANTKFIWIGKDGTIVIVEPKLDENGEPLVDEEGNYVFEFPGEGMIAQIDVAE